MPGLKKGSDPIKKKLFKPKRGQLSSRTTWYTSLWLQIIRSHRAISLVTANGTLTLKVLVATIDALGHFETG